ncbi:hypothetical protein IscW_ISCW018994, partial [Ixodes scapularis]
ALIGTQPSALLFLAAAIGPRLAGASRSRSGAFPSSSLEGVSPAGSRGLDFRQPVFSVHEAPPGSAGLFGPSPISEFSFRPTISTRRGSSRPRYSSGTAPE